MSSPIVGYEVARSGTTVVVRAIGLANMKNAPVLDGFLEDSVQRDMSLVCIDLSLCTGMDSTFMGVLVGRSQHLATKEARLVIVNPTANGMRLLTMLGLDQVIPVVESVPQTELTFIPLASRDAVPPRERLELIKRAHENLASLSDSNQGKFAAFLTALERDLQRLDQSKI